MKQQLFNTPSFFVNVFVYHPATGELVRSYRVEQSVSKHSAQFSATTRAVHDQLENQQSQDGLRYVAYFPIWESWNKGGNRVFESTIGG